MSVSGQHSLENCPAEVRLQLEKLVAGFQSRLANNLVGIYLHGSLAMGCFNPLRSDIDLLVVTRQQMSVETKRDLAKFLLETSLNPAQIEISFLRLSDLNPWQYPTPFDFHYSEDWREDFERKLSDDGLKDWDDEPRYDKDLAAHITILNHRGTCLYGLEINEIFPYVPKQDFIDSILADVLSEECGFDAILQNPVYVVLNACRTLAFLRTEHVMSKDEGGSWALDFLPAEFHPIIAAALEEYRRNNGGSSLRKEELIKFSLYMRAEVSKLYKESMKAEE